MMYICIGSLSVIISPSLKTKSTTFGQLQIQLKANSMISYMYRGRSHIFQNLNLVHLFRVLPCEEHFLKRIKLKLFQCEMRAIFTAIFADKT